METKLIEENVGLSEDQVNRIAAFHQFTFSQVLKLEKYPMIFKAEGNKDAYCSLFVVPLNNSKESIDWAFLDSIGMKILTKVLHLSLRADV